MKHNYQVGETVTILVNPGSSYRKDYVFAKVTRVLASRIELDNGKQYSLKTGKELNSFSKFYCNEVVPYQQAHTDFNESRKAARERNALINEVASKKFAALTNEQLQTILSMFEQNNSCALNIPMQ